MAEAETRLAGASFNTQPPEGGWADGFTRAGWLRVSTRSRPKAAGAHSVPSPFAVFWFQHAAARRRLVKHGNRKVPIDCFNTQPPEGGWSYIRPIHGTPKCFNTQPPEGGWSAIGIRGALLAGFNTQPPEGGWIPI